MGILSRIMSFLLGRRETPSRRIAPKPPDACVFLQAGEGQWRYVCLPDDGVVHHGPLPAGDLPPPMACCQIVWRAEQLASLHGQTQGAWIDAARAAATVGWPSPPPDPPVEGEINDSDEPAVLLEDDRDRVVGVNILLGDDRGVEWFQFEALQNASLPFDLRCHGTQILRDPPQLRAMTTKLQTNPRPTILVGHLPEIWPPELQAHLQELITLTLTPDQLLKLFAEVWVRALPAEEKLQAERPQPDSAVELTHPAWAWGASVTRRSVFQASGHTASAPIALSQGFLPIQTLALATDWNDWRGRRRTQLNCEVAIARKARGCRLAVRLDLCRATGSIRGQVVQQDRASGRSRVVATARGIDIREASHLAPAGAPASIVLLIVMPPPGQCERFHQRATQLAAELLASGRLIGLGAAWAHPAGLRSHAWNAESLAGAATDELRGCFAGPPPGAIPSEGLPETLEWLQMKFASRPDTARGLLIALVAPQTYELAPDAIWHSPEGCWAWQAAMRKSIGAPLAFASIVDGDAGSASRSPFLEALARLTALGAQARSSEGLIRCWSAEEPLASVRDDAAGLVALADSLTARHQAFMERQPLPADRRLRVVANSGTIATRLRPVTSVG